MNHYEYKYIFYGQDHKQGILKFC